MHSRGSTAERSHSHMWLFGVLGLAAGLALMVFVPRLKPLEHMLLVQIGLYILGAIVLLTSLHALAGPSMHRHHLRHSGRHPAATDRYDFGWHPGMTAFPLTAALVLWGVAVVLQVTLPLWWPLALLLTLLAANFFAGYLIVRTTTRADRTALPMVDLFQGDHDLILDAGCGAGRTTLSLGRVLKQGQIVAVDRFDADYIDAGGRDLLENNLRLAGLTNRVRIETGDLKRLPFEDQTFDAAVSAHALDHLGPDKGQGMREVLRVLKPGGRLLVVASVPGWTTFAIVNMLSLFLMNKGGWRNLTRTSGFDLVEEGDFNGFWYLLVRRPA